MASVSIFLDLLEEEHYRSTAEISKRAQGQAKNVRRLIGLVNDLLTIEKLESDRVDLDLSTFDCCQLSNDVNDAVSALLAQRQLSLNWKFSNEAIEITADRSKVIQVLVNLVSNAMKFSEPGQSVEVDIVDETEWIRFTVTDHGRGIPANKQQEIFEKYAQVETSDSNQKGGTGLGLPICKAIVEAHGGLIGVQSRVGKGSNFWMKLPRGTLQLNCSAP